MLQEQEVMKDREGGREGGREIGNNKEITITLPEKTLGCEEW